MSTLSKPRALSFPELLELSTAELEHLRQSKDRLDDFIDKLPLVQKLNSDVENVITSNEELASECTENSRTFTRSL
jgi:hypothetical protein